MANFESCEVCWVNCSPHHSTKYGASWRSSVFSWQTFLRPGSVQPHCSLWPFQCWQFQWKTNTQIISQRFRKQIVLSFSSFQDHLSPSSPIHQFEKRKTPYLHLWHTFTEDSGLFQVHDFTFLHKPATQIHHVQNRECTQKGVTKDTLRCFSGVMSSKKNWNGRSVAWKDRPNRRSHGSLIGTMLFSLMSSRNLSNKNSAKTRETPFVSKYQSWNFQNLPAPETWFQQNFSHGLGSTPPKDDNYHWFLCKESQPSNQSFICQGVESKA